MITRILRAVSYLLNLVEMVLIFRAISSWFLHIPFVRPIYDLATLLTEPIVSPVRNLLYRYFPGASQSPLDLSVLATFLLIGLIRVLIL